MWGLFIFVLTSLPVPAQASVLPAWSDKVVHVALYGAFGVLVWRSLPTTMARTAASRLLVTVLIATVYGAVDEWHQQFIPGRRADRADWCADIAGGTGGALLALAFSRQELRS